MKEIYYFKEVDARYRGFSDASSESIFPKAEAAVPALLEHLELSNPEFSEENKTTTQKDILDSRW